MNSTTLMETQYFRYENNSNMTMAQTPCLDMSCILYAVANTIICILGIIGNGLVIWITGFKLKSINATWYLSLALSDVIFCCTLPVGIVHVIKNDWIFGLFWCKFLFFNMYLNWFSSIFLLVIISVDRCVVVMFPVWTQNHRTTRKASVIVLLAWIISAICSMPSAVYLVVEKDSVNLTNVCYPKYESDQEEVADVVLRFIFGFLIPFFVIIFCYVIIIRKLKYNQISKSKKPFKIMTVLIAAFLVCWLPHHIVYLMSLNYEKYKSFLDSGLTIAIIFANANSCLNPFLYAFMGKDFKNQCYRVLSKMENAIKEDEDLYKPQETATTISGERNLSTSV